MAYNGSSSVVAIITNRPISTAEVFPSATIMKLGVTQLICGNLAIILATVAMIVDVNLCYLGTGLWCGVVFITSGVFGILSARNTSLRNVTAYMVLSIISAVLANVLLVISVISLLLQPKEYPSPDTSVHSTWYYYSVSFNTMLLTIAFIEEIFSVISAAFGCKVTCLCCNQTEGNPGSVYYYSGQL